MDKGKKPSARLVPVDIRDSGRSLIMIKGYLSDREDTVKENEHWWEAIRQAGWRDSIYQLWWDASTPYSFSLNVLKSVLIPGMAVLKAGVAVSEGLRHWRKIHRRARRVGESLFQELLAPVSHDRLTIVGFSLGALMTWHALKTGNTQGLNIDRVFMLGGAFPADNQYDLARVCLIPEERLFNVYNSEDNVLRYFYPLGQLPIPGFDTLQEAVRDVRPERIKGITRERISQKLLEKKRHFQSRAETQMARLRTRMGQGIDLDQMNLSQLEAHLPHVPCGVQPIVANSQPINARITNIDATEQIGRSPRNHWHYYKVIPQVLGPYLSGPARTDGRRALPDPEEPTG